MALRACNLTHAPDTFCDQAEKATQRQRKALLAPLRSYATATGPLDSCMYKPIIRLVFKDMRAFSVPPPPCASQEIN